MISLSNKQHWLIEQSFKHPNNQAIKTEQKTISYKEFYNTCSATANYLIDKGIKKNDHVGILFGHSYEFYILINALWFIGAIPVPFNTRNTIEEIETQLIQADIKFLVVDEIRNSQFAIRNFREVIICSENIKYNVQNHKSKIPNPKPARRQTWFKIQNSALIMFTSGSSGKPKAVVHTFKSLLESVKSTNTFTSLSQKNIWLASLPFYHIGGFMILCRSLLTGSLVVFPPSLKFEDLNRSIKHLSPTHLSFVSTTLRDMLDHNIKPNKILKYVFLGGGPTEDDLFNTAAKNGWPIIKVYGSTETCSMVTALNPKEIKTKSSSVGKPIGKNKILIKTKRKNMIIGEVIVHCNSLFKNYYNDQRTTDRKLKHKWYYTGDNGWIDKDGYLFIDSRREDLIISGGENVNPHEIETVIKAFPFIRDVFVFGFKDKKWGQKICAVIVSENVSENEIKIFLKTKIAGYKIPKLFYFVHKIPRNEMGKVLRSELLKELNLNFY